MGIQLDLTDKLARFPVPYGWQPIRGWPVKHFDDVIGQSTQRTMQNALGEGPWDALETLWVDAFPIDSSNFTFHPGLGDDAPDTYFPADPAHPWTAYVGAKCPQGLTDDQLSNLFGIYRTLRTPNFDGNGNQLNSVGTVVTPADPRTEYFFKPNPANVAADQLIRWGKRPQAVINFPAWVDWRDYNDELIPWDDSKYTPRSLSLTPTTGGTLSAGTTYYVRVSAIKGGDQSSASLKTSETDANSILLTGFQNAFQVNWLVKGDENTPQNAPTDIDSFRVYVGTVPGVWLGYFSVAGAASRNLIITTVAGVTAGSPLDLCTSGLMRNIKRFQCMPFFIPPYDLGQALDKICQISCADWQWSGLGTNTYRNDKIRFMSPATRASVFTLNLAETGMASFKTYPIDRTTRPNQIIVDFRDLDDPYLNQGQPVILDREQLQEDDRQVRTFTIDGGTMYRSQAQRCASFYARVLCDMDQMAEMAGSPKSYHVLPGDVVKVTNETPDWTDVQFMVRKKEEKVESSLGDPFLLQLYTPGMYSDTDHKPLPRALPSPKVDPFQPPPVASSLVLLQTTAGSIKGTFQFTAFGGPQRARIYVKRMTSPADADFHPVTLALPSGNDGFFLIPGLPDSEYQVKVITESVLGIFLPAGHPVGTIIIQPFQMSGPLVVLDASGDFQIEANGNPRAGDVNPQYVCEDWSGTPGSSTLKRTLQMVAGGTTRAAILSADHTTYDPVSGTFETSSWAYKNNLFSTPFFGATVSQITAAFQRFDFSMKFGWTPDGGGFIQIGTFRVSLQESVSLTGGVATVNFSLSPLSIEWTTDLSDLEGTVVETIRSYNTVLSVRHNIDPGFGGFTIVSHEIVDNLPNRPGQRYTFLINGNELSVYARFNPAGGNIPLAKTTLNPLPFPLRLVANNTMPPNGASDSEFIIRSVMFGGAVTPGTIYARREQVEDFGSPQTALHLRLYQKSETPGITGIPLDISVP